MALSANGASNERKSLIQILGESRVIDRDQAREAMEQKKGFHRSHRNNSHRYGRR